MRILLCQLVLLLVNILKQHWQIVEKFTFILNTVTILLFTSFHSVNLHLSLGDALRHSSALNWMLMGLQQAPGSNAFDYVHHLTSL